MTSRLRWIPLALAAAAVLGIVGAAVSVAVDADASAWPGSGLGGSTLYTINVLFARLWPFLIALGVGVALWQRTRQRREAAPGPGVSVRRHEWTDIATHWTNAVGVGLALITAVWLLDWLDSPLSLEATYSLHLVGSGLTLAAVGHHLAFHGAGGGRGLIPRSWRDLKNALAELVSYTGVYRGLRGVFGLQLPGPIRRPAGRALRRLRLAPDPPEKFLATERVLSYPVWAILLAVVVVTGVVKAIHYVYALPEGLRDGLTFVHDGATLFLLIFLAIHVGALVLVPRNWPLLRSMITSRIARAYVRTNLPRWERELAAEEASATAGRQAPPGDTLP